MVLTHEERVQALKIFYARKESNRKYMEQHKAGSDNKGRIGRPPIEQPTELQLEHILQKYKEKLQKRNKIRNPKTPEDIQDCINRLTFKMMNLQDTAS